MELKPNLNIEVADEYNVGCALESDLKGVTAVRPQFVWKPACMMAWLRADVYEKQVMVGAAKKLYDNVKV